ncbi:MAG: hypothetical protein GC162_10845 [Planctomycetes bacterium]|nr:hypothetical protein [Planctomycetota bacterium]
MLNELQNTKIQGAILPAAIKDDAAFAAQVIDKTDFPGCDYLEFVGVLGSIDATAAVLKVMESDTKTNATTLGGTPSLVKDSTTKPGANDDGKTFVFGIDLHKTRQRYLQLQGTAGDGAAGTFLAAVVIGRRLVESSPNAADRGLLFAQYA